MSQDGDHWDSDCLEYTSTFLLYFIVWTRSCTQNSTQYTKYTNWDTDSPCFITHTHTHYSVSSVDQRHHQRDDFLGVQFIHLFSCTKYWHPSTQIHPYQPLQKENSVIFHKKHLIFNKVPALTEQHFTNTSEWEKYLIQNFTGTEQKENSCIYIFTLAV